MSDTVIRVENLGKRYSIGHKQSGERYTALRDVIANSVKGTVDKFRKTRQVRNSSTEDFWALKNIDFEIDRGDRIGIIGRNGAGKSTLLKVLSRITEPTTGKISINGKVASLLEVGTGFHPELSGRENIFLNGAILGMNKREISRKFDEIVSFAEVDKFLDTPVKRYSSGMYVRLAFAVAAHLETEILVVDEVLAVGDADFQRKCLGKMEDVTNEQGKTVLFVSHNMTAVEHLCNKGIHLISGSVDYAGTKEEAINRYLLSGNKSGADSGVLFEVNNSQKDEELHQILKVVALDKNGDLVNKVRTWDDLTLRIYYSSPERVERAGFCVKIKDRLGTALIHCSTQPMSGFNMNINSGMSAIDCEIKKLPLSSGTYNLEISMAIPFVRDLCMERDIDLNVMQKDIYGSGFPPRHAYSPIAVSYDWQTA